MSVFFKTPLALWSDGLLSAVPGVSGNDEFGNPITFLRLLNEAGVGESGQVKQMSRAS